MKKPTTFRDAWIATRWCMTIKLINWAVSVAPHDKKFLLACRDAAARIGEILGIEKDTRRPTFMHFGKGPPGPDLGSVGDFYAEGDPDTFSKNQRYKKFANGWRKISRDEWIGA